MNRVRRWVAWIFERIATGAFWMARRITPKP